MCGWMTNGLMGRDELDIPFGWGTHLPFPQTVQTPDMSGQVDSNFLLLLLGIRL